MKTRIKMTGVLALTVSALLVFAMVPATAKPTKPPGKPGGLYDVTMTLAGGDGLATTCGPLVMKEDRNGSLLAVGEASLQLEALIQWQRKYPSPDFGDYFTGCHDGSLVDSMVPDYEGRFSIDRDLGAGTVSFLWHFDYYIAQDETCNIRNGKCRTRQTVREHFTMVSDPIPFQGNSGLAEGKFHVSWYLNEDGELIHPYDQFGETTFRFQMEITAHSG